VRDPNEIVRTGYEQLGNRYWEWSRDNDPKYRERYVDSLLGRLAPNSRVVELGSGSGVPTAQMLASRHRLTCVDIAMSQLALIAKNAPDAHRVCAAMTDVAFAQGIVDAVVAFYSIIHVPREQHASLFTSIASWLRPGGSFVASLAASDNPGGTEAWIDDVEMYWSSYDADTNLALITEAGLDIASDEVLKNFEDGREVRFLWVVATKPG